MAPRRQKRGAVLDTAARRIASIIGRGAQGAALAHVLAREGVRTRADLKAPNILARLPRRARIAVQYNLSRGESLATAAAIATEVQRRLVFARGQRARRKVLQVGSLRRRAARVKDIDLLVVVPERAGGPARGFLEGATLRPPQAGDRVELAETYAVGARRRSLVLRVAPADGRPVKYYRADLFLATEREKPYALFHYTGSKLYNIRTRAVAKRHGWLLNQYGLFDAASGHRARAAVGVRSERDIAGVLGVSYRPPTDRAK